MQNTNNKIECKSFIISANSTNTPWTTSVQLLSLTFSAVGAVGSAWVITIQDKSGTPVQIYSKTLAVNDNIVVAAYTDLGGLEMTNGMDIILSGTAAGAVHVKVNAMRLGHD